MKDMMQEKLVHLAAAQTCMMNVADGMEEWSERQLNTEQTAYESLNASDMVLNLSKEGNRLVELLQGCCSEISKGTSTEKYLKMSSLMEEIKNLFQNINTVIKKVNDNSHIIEEEIAKQKDIENDIQQNLLEVKDCLDCAVACVELLMADEI